MKVLALFLVFLGLCWAQSAPTGNSYCNSGTCSTITDCDLGLCCGGKCVQSAPTVLAKDAACNASNYCEACPTGQYCDSFTAKKCVDLPKSTCGKSEGCDCAAATDCLSSFCASDKKCHQTGLSANDKCVDNSQCASQNCTANVCVGAAAGATCSPFLSSCGYGLACVASGFTGTCTAGPKVGDTCNTSCGDFGASCQSGKCANFYSVAESGACTANQDCKPPAVCTGNKCVTPSGNCRPTNCGEFQGCKCTSDNKGTVCTDQYNFCSTEWTAYATCMRTSQCFGFSFASEWNPNTCSVANCQKEMIALTCCQNCGAKTNNFIINPIYGLDCTAKTVTPLGCDTTKCPRTPSSCPTIPSSTTDTPSSTTDSAASTTDSAASTTGSVSGAVSTTASQPVGTTGADSSASVMGASFALIVAVIALL